MAGPFYVDFEFGDDTNDGEGIGAGNAWKTLDKPATTIGAGEICFVRANKSWTPSADTDFTNDGTINSPIKIIGADAVTNDPWSDGSDVLPLVDYAGGVFQTLLKNDNYWHLERLHIKNSHDTEGGIRVTGSIGVVLDACKLDECIRAGLSVTNSSILVKNSTFLDNGTEGTTRGSLAFTSSFAYFYNCTFDPFSTDRRILQGSGGATILFEKCAFGQLGTLFVIDRGAHVKARNCTFVTSVVSIVSPTHRFSEYEIKGNQQLQVLIDGTNMDTGLIDKARQWRFQYPGEIDSDVAYARSGGAVQGWRFQAGANCNADVPLVLTYPVHVDDTDSHDYSMFCKFQANPFDKGADLDETEITFTITELKADGTIVQTTMGATTWDFDNTSTWQEGAVTAFSASSAGELRIDVFVVSAGGDVYIDTPVGEAGAGNEGYAEGGLLYNLANVGGGGGGLLTHPGMTGGMRG